MYLLPGQGGCAFTQHPVLYLVAPMGIEPILTCLSNKRNPRLHRCYGIPGGSRTPIEVFRRHLPLSIRQQGHGSSGENRTHRILLVKEASPPDDFRAIILVAGARIELAIFRLSVECISKYASLPY
jgi:hypothetical protein